MTGLRAMAVALGSRAIHFLAWWIAELRGLLPERWRSRPQAHVEARVGHGTIRVSGWQGEPVDIPLDPNAPPSAVSVPIALPVWLVPPSEAVLSRIVQVPRAAAARFETLLQAEADRWTSFPVDQIIYGWGLPRAVDDNRVEIELRFVARATASGWAKALAARGLAPSWLVLGPEERFKVRWRDAGPSRRRVLGARHLLVAATVAAAILAICTDWIAARREQAVWQERIGAQRLHLGRQRELETQIANLLAAAGAADSTRAQPRAMQFAALAAALPATDWLTELSFRDETLTLRGYAKNVELLLKALEPLARDGVVTVQGELALDARLERQRFTVSLRGKGAS
jgi:hypothetical protein